QGKRPMMAEVAELYARHLVITDDNPRTENADEIVRHIASGVSDQSIITIERDRAKAIAFAIQNAAPGDVVLIAGKGHENYQDVNGERTPFRDMAQARQALLERVSTKQAGNQSGLRPCHCRQ